VLAAIANTANDGSGIGSLTDLQSVTDAAILAYEAEVARQARLLPHLQTVQAYANDNGVASATPTLNTLLSLELTGVSTANVGAINSALASAAITGADVATPAAIQALVDAYNRILAEANGSAADATPGANPDAATYAAIGATTAAALANGSAAQSLLNSVVAERLPSEVNTVAKVEALASTVSALAQLAAGATVPTPAPAITPEQLAAIGLSGVTPANLAELLDAIAQSPDNGSGIASLSLLQGVVDQVNTAIVARAQDAISAYAGDAALPAGATAPTLSDFATIGVTGVTSANLAAIHSALASAAITGTDVATPAQVQALVDAYNRVIA